MLEALPFQDILRLAVEGGFLHDEVAVGIPDGSLTPDFFTEVRVVVVFDAVIVYLDPVRPGLVCS